MAKLSRVKAKKSSDRWHRGQSSSSNPTSFRHRNSAKNKRSINVDSALTVQSLQQHDVRMGEKDKSDFKDDEDIATAKTFDTIATDISHCTNKSFSKVIQGFDPRSEQSRQILAVLAAVTDVIKERGSGEESSSEYFSVLLTFIEQQVEGFSKDEEMNTESDIESLSASMTLINALMKSIPTSVLVSKFTDIANVFKQVLIKFEDTKASGTSISRCTISCVTYLLNAQPFHMWLHVVSSDKDQRDENLQQNELNFSPLQFYKETLLPLILTSRPKVRKSGHDAIHRILSFDPSSKDDNLIDEAATEEEIGNEIKLKSNRGGEIPHPASLVTAQACITILKQLTTRVKKTTKCQQESTENLTEGTTLKKLDPTCIDQTSLLHLITLLSQIFQYFSPSKNEKIILHHILPTLKLMHSSSNRKQKKDILLVTNSLIQYLVTVFQKAAVMSEEEVISMEFLWAKTGFSLLKEVYAMIVTYTSDVLVGEGRGGGNKTLVQLISLVSDVVLCTTSLHCLSQGVESSSDIVLSDVWFQCFSNLSAIGWPRRMKGSLVLKSATHAMTKVMSHILKIYIPNHSDKLDQQDIGKLCQIFDIIHSGIEFKEAFNEISNLLATIFELMSPFSLPTLSQNENTSIWETLRTKCCQLFLPKLVSLRQSNEADTSPENSTYNTKFIDHVISKALSSLNPEIVLQYIPFEIEETGEVKNGWILPLITSNNMAIKHANLQHFIEFFLPLADQCDVWAEQNQHNELKHKLFSSLKDQIWSVLKVYCNHPLDLPSQFRKIARRLGESIKESDYRYKMHVFAALRQLISKFESLNTPYGLECRAVLSKFAKNFLPILFNVYTTSSVSSSSESESSSMEESCHSSCLETIKYYLKLTDPTLMGSLYDSAFAIYKQTLVQANGVVNTSKGVMDAANQPIKKKKKASLNNDSSVSMETEQSVNNNLVISDYAKLATLDLLQALIPYQSDEKRIGMLYECVIVSKMKSSNHTTQKRAYRLLDHIIASASAGVSANGCSAFVTGNVETICRLLTSSLSRTVGPSQTYRLRCLIHLLKLKCMSREVGDEGNKQFSFLLQVVPEAVLCVKANNSKARENAYTLIVTIGECLIALSDDKDPNTSLAPYFETIMSGVVLSGSVSRKVETNEGTNGGGGASNMVRCALLASGRLYHAFKDVINDELCEKLIGNVCLLFTSNSREVVGAALSFSQVFLSTLYNSENGSTYLKQMMIGFSAMSDDCKRHFRIKSRLILTRLVRKFDLQYLISLVPQDDEKMLKRLRNVMKSENRSKRKAVSGSTILNEGDEHSDGLSKRNHDYADSTLNDSDDIMRDAMAGDSDDEDFDQSTDEERQNERSNRFKSIKKRSTSTSAGVGLLTDQVDDITDFLDQTTILSKLKSQDGVKHVSKKSEENGGFRLNAQGKLIINEESSDEDNDFDEIASTKTSKTVSKKTNDENDSLDDSTSISLKNGGKKRKIMSSTKDTSSVKSYKPGGSGIHRPLKKVGNQNTSMNGQQFKSKKGGGDVKRKDQALEPFAYIPLNRDALNKRKRAQAVSEINKMVKKSTVKTNGTNKGGKGSRFGDGRISKKRKMIKR